MTISPTPEQERKIQEALRAGLIDSPEQLLDLGLEQVAENQALQTSKQSAAEAIDRAANFGERHGLSLAGLKMKDLINEGRR
jgi:hypothetical protein